MGTRWCARTVFILYGFLFECVLLTGLLMASSFPAQGSVIRPYPGHAKRARTPENKVPDPPQGLPKFDLGNESADLPRERRLLRVDYRGSQRLLLLASSSEAGSAQLPFFFGSGPLQDTCLEDECKINLVRPSHTPALLKIYEAGFLRGDEGLSISNVSPAGRKMYLSQGAAEVGGISALQKECKSDIWA